MGWGLLLSASSNIGELVPGGGVKNKNMNKKLMLNCL